RPGTITVQLTSTALAPRGMRTEPEAPTATILPSRTSSVPLSIGVVVTGMIHAPVNAIVSARAVSIVVTAKTAKSTALAVVRATRFSAREVLDILVSRGRSGNAKIQESQWHRKAPATAFCERFRVSILEVKLREICHEIPERSGRHSSADQARQHIQ